MATVKELKATARPQSGKGAARAERRAGRVPAVIYGDNQPPLPISVDDRELRLRIFAGAVFKLWIVESKPKPIDRRWWWLRTKYMFQPAGQSRGIASKIKLTKLSPHFRLSRCRLLTIVDPRRHADDDRRRVEEPKRPQPNRHRLALDHLAGPKAERALRLCR